MKKRIFIGLKIPINLRSKILKWERKFPDLPARWILENNLHITLIPPFYVRDIRAVIKKLNVARRNFSDPIVVEFKRVSFGPDPKRPRLIWAKGVASQELLNLKKFIHKLLGIPAEKRPFSLHITLARLRPENFKHFAAKKMDEKIFWKYEAGSIVLFGSKLLAGGAQYEILEEIKMKK